MLTFRYKGDKIISYMGSTSSTFYMRIFRSFSQLHFGFVIFWGKDIGKKVPVKCWWNWPMFFARYFTTFLALLSHLVHNRQKRHKILQLWTEADKQIIQMITILVTILGPKSVIHLVSHKKGEENFGKLIFGTFHFFNPRRTLHFLIWWVGSSVNHFFLR